MLEELSPEQEELMRQVREEWLAKIFDPEKRLVLNKGDAKKSIEWLYSFCKLKKPRIVFSSSPMDSQNIVRDNVVANVRDNVRDNVRANVRANVRDNVVDNVGANVGANVWANVWDNFWDNVGANVGANVVANVWDNVGANVRGKFICPSWRGSVSDYGWCSYHDFFKRIGINNDDNFDTFLDLLNSGIYELITLEELCVVCPMPLYIERTAPNPGDTLPVQRLHSIDRMAIEWGDGWGQHYLYGVYFDKKLWEKVTKNPKKKEIFSIENMEQRMAAIKTVGAEMLLDDAKLLDSSERGNELYLVSGVFSQDAYILKYKDPSTDRVYTSGIDPEYAKDNPKADSCMAWKFHMSPQEYSSLTIEA